MAPNKYSTGNTLCCPLVTDWSFYRLDTVLVLIIQDEEGQELLLFLLRFERVSLLCFSKTVFRLCFRLPTTVFMLPISKEQESVLIVFNNCDL